MGPTDHNFRQIKIIIRISQWIFLFLLFIFFYYDLFLLDYNKLHKKQKSNALGLVELWSLLYVSC